MDDRGWSGHVEWTSICDATLSFVAIDSTFKKQEKKIGISTLKQPFGAKSTS